MSPNDSAVLVRLDAALLSLRRLTNAPAARPQLTHGGRRVEFSTMLVVDAIARLSGRHNPDGVRANPGGTRRQEEPS